MKVNGAITATVLSWGPYHATILHVMRDFTGIIINLQNLFRNTFIDRTYQYTFWGPLQKVDM